VVDCFGDEEEEEELWRIFRRPCGSRAAALPETTLAPLLRLCLCLQRFPSSTTPPAAAPFSAS
jgi:hypothetical protein